MTTTATASRPSRSAMPAKRMSVSDIQTKGKNLPSRFILHGTEGIGKTSFAAQAPAPIFLMARGETGLETLIDSGRLPDVPHWPEIQSWSDLLGAIEALTTEEHGYKTLVIDTLNGCERLCHEMVCNRDFGGDWGKSGFTSYMTGFEVSLAPWREFLVALDSLREKRRMSVLALCHTKVVSFKNPEGADYDRYAPDMHQKTWSLTHKWADGVLFANFEVFVDEKGARAKGKGGNVRMIYTERTAAYDAKNRHGLPTEISMGTSSQESWDNFKKAIQTGKESS